MNCLRNHKCILKVLPRAVQILSFVKHYSQPAVCDDDVRMHLTVKAMKNGQRNVSSILRQLQRDINVERFCPIWLFQRLPHCSQVLACIKGPRVEYHVRLAFGHP